MTTTVKVTAHNFPATVTVTNFSEQTQKSLVSDHSHPEVPIEGSQVHYTQIQRTFVLRDGQSAEFTVTDSQSVNVAEHKADQEPHGEN